MPAAEAAQWLGPNPNEGSRASGRSRSDGLATVCVWLTAILVTAVFMWILGDLLRHGLGGISWSFFIEPPTHAGRDGGIGPIIISTVLILGVCLAAAVPLGVGTAALLAEFSPPDSRFGKMIRHSLNVLAGVPSIVFGLFGNAFFCIYLGMGFSILSGGLTLACMVLPILTRATEEGFRSVPGEYRMAAAALGMTRTGAFLHLLLPAAAPGVLVGLVLGIGRALAETAALIFTSGYVDRTPWSLMDSGRSLSIHIYDLAMNVPGGEPNAYATALVLVGLLLVTNQTASFITNYWLHKKFATG